MLSRGLILGENLSWPETAAAVGRLVLYHIEQGKGTRQRPSEWQKAAGVVPGHTPHTVVEDALGLCLSGCRSAAHVQCR